MMVKMQPVHQPRPLPVVLSGEEVARLIAAAPNAKYQAALSVAYGAGLRASEVVALKVTDVDGERMTLRVEQGKGRKDRCAMLSPVLLERLRAWWRVAHAQGKMLPNGWLFPGLNPIEHRQSGSASTGNSAPPRCSALSPSQGAMPIPTTSTRRPKTPVERCRARSIAMPLPVPPPRPKTMQTTASPWVALVLAPTRRRAAAIGRPVS